MKTETKYKKCCLCIISKNKKYLLQLRDNIKNIKDPNTWGLFGGHLKKNENIKPNKTEKESQIKEMTLFVRKSQAEVNYYKHITNN